MIRVSIAPDPGAAAAAERGRFPFRRLRIALCLLLACWPSRPARVWAAAWPSPESGGAAEAPLAVFVREPSLACAWEGSEGEPRLQIIVPLDAEALARPGVLDAALECASTRYLEIVPRLLPPSAWQREADPYGAVAPWLESLAAFLDLHAGRLRRVELSPGAPGDLEPLSWAYLVEKCGSLLRSFRPPYGLVTGPFDGGDPSWLRSIPHTRLRPYIDAISVSEGSMRALADEVLPESYPGVPLWLHLDPGADPGDLLARVHAGRASGASTIVLPEAPTEEARRVEAAFIHFVSSRYVPDPAPPGIWIDEPRGGTVAGEWADTLGPERIAILRLPMQELAVRLRTGGGALRQLRAFDLADGRELAGRVEPAQKEGEPPVVLLDPPRGPLLIRYVTEGDPRAEPERVGVTAEIELTAPEIIARLRAVEETQRRATQHYTALATLSYHYRADTVGIAVDVTSVNRFFWEEGVGDYEEIELYVNGARWRGPAANLPFIQADKVKEVPIEVRLDEAYGYRLAGRERVRGRQAYVLEFDPAASGGSRYSGRVWIDAETFERLKIRLVQEGLEPPITSSEDVIEYGPAPGAAAMHWVPLQGYRQMVFTVLGRSVVVERTVLYEDFALNGENFEEVRKLAWGSGRRMARDDQDGFAYMIGQPGGGLLRQSESLKNVALVGGLSVGTSPVVSSPLAGINFFDFDWRGTGTQVDIAWAGPFILGSWSDPSLAGTRWELSAEGHLLGAREKLKRTTDDGRRREEDLDVLSEAAMFTLARPLSTNTKAEVQLQARHEWFDHTDETGAGMLVPPDLLTTTALGRWRYNRSGFGLEAWGSAARRSAWEDWGFVPEDPNEPEGARGTRDDDRYHRWGLSISKAFYPGGFQKLNMGVSFNAGSGLDRFSRFRVGEFGSVGVKGFNGRDYGFDRGLSGRIEWLAPIPGTGLSVELNLDGAVIENREDFTSRPEDIGVRNPTFREHIVGGGIGVSFNGPWSSLIIISGSRMIDTSMDATASSPSVSIKIIKTFGDWPWRHEPLELDRRSGRAEAPAVIPQADQDSQSEKR